MQGDHHWYIINVSHHLSMLIYLTPSQRNITQLDIKQERETIQRVRGTTPPGTPMLRGKVRPMNSMFSDSLTGLTSRNIRNTRPEKL